MDQLRFEAYDPTQLADWLASSRRHYITERMAAGDTEAEATVNADRSFDRLFADGRPVPGQLVGQVVDTSGRRVGELWIGLADTDPARWWVWNIEIDAPLRGRGLGRAAMVLAEDLARTAGATSLGLNVFAHNAVARGLYTSFGYQETAVQMQKALG